MKLTVLSRQYCHLCDELLAELRRFQQRFDFDIEVVDVDAAEPALEERWGDKVPVVLDGPIEVCHYHLDHEAVESRLRGGR